MAGRAKTTIRGAVGNPGLLPSPFLVGVDASLISGMALFLARSFIFSHSFSRQFFDLEQGRRLLGDVAHAIHEGIHGEQLLLNKTDCWFWKVAKARISHFGSLLRTRTKWQVHPESS